VAKERIMTEQAVETSEEETADRREFLKRAAQASLTAPAVALLLSAADRPAFARSPYSHHHLRPHGWGA
jgi:hypothetical protein